MGSTRDHNVSILQIPDLSASKSIPITSFTDTGGSLRSAPRSVLMTDDELILNNKNLKQPIQDNLLSETLPKHRQNDPNKPLNMLMTSGVHSSIMINSSGRELSPVRWCDREVDGVYLGRSGWVQVQQRSFDDSRKEPNKNGMVSTLPTRIKISPSDSSGKKEQRRPGYLPIPSDKISHREYYKTPSPLHTLEATSPPTITPIISPPPAFKDSGIESDLRRTSHRRLVYGKPPHLFRSRAIVDSQSPPVSPPHEQRSSRLRKLPSFPVSDSRQHYPKHLHQTKSLDENSPSRNKSYNSSSSLYQTEFDQKHRNNSVVFIEEDLKNDGFKTKPLVLESLEEERIPSQCFFQCIPQKNGKWKATSGDKYLKRCSSSSSISSTTSSSSSMSESSNSGTYNTRSHSTSLKRVPLQETRQKSEGSFFDVRNSKVRRSRSLQLSEKRSPVAPVLTTPSVCGRPWNPTPNNYYPPENMGDTFSISSRVTVNGTIPVPVPSDKVRRHYPKVPPQDEKNQELLREAAKEAQIVSDYLNRSRSRAAARNLLMHRFLNRSESESQNKMKNSQPEIEYDIHIVEKPRKPGKKSSHHRHEVLLYGGKDSTVNGYTCNSASCEFWPDCGSREKNVYVKPVIYAEVPFGRGVSMKPSQSYPCRSGEKSKRDDKNGGLPSGSFEVRINGAKKSNKEDSVYKQTYTSSSRDKMATSSRIDKKISPNQEIKLKSNQINKKYEKTKSRMNGFLENGSRKTGKYGAEDGIKIYETNYIQSPFTSSSSSDACLSSPEKRSFRTTKMSEDTHVNDYWSSSGSGSAFNAQKTDTAQESSYSRPGSAPMSQDDENGGDAHQRSLSLPKSFLSNRYGIRYNEPGTLFSWRRDSADKNDNSRKLQYLDISKTAPATPIREIGSIKENDCLSKSNQKSSSTPLLDESVAEAEFNAQKQANKESNRNARSGRKDTSPSRTTVPESVLDKFKKSISMKFAKAKGNNPKNCDGVEYRVDDLNVRSGSQPTLEPTLMPMVNESTGDQKFRFGSLIWRSSKERRRCKKAARNAKCNSGDSGIQLEIMGNIGGESSESHDTDQHDDMESPTLIRSRGPRKFFRPQSEVISQILKDKFQVDHPYRNHTKRYYKGRGIRRTNSDLGGQRLFNCDNRNQYIKLLSASSPIKEVDIKRSLRQYGSSDRMDRWSKLPGGHRLKRSLSQPIGLDKLSPILRPRTLGVKSLSEDEHDLEAATSEDEAISESGSSIASLANGRKKSFDAVDDKVMLAEGLWDHVAMELDELPFKAGDVIEVLDTFDRDWWWGTTGENFGYFPSAFVRLRVSQEDTVEDCLAALASGKKNSSHLRRRTSVSLLSNDQVRSGVVRELFNTEKDFVKILQDVTEGFIAECRKRTDMFTPEQIKTIFSNLEDLLLFQKKFLKDLESRVNHEFPHKSCIGEIFLNHRSGFRKYSEYCNSHPMAIATLQELYQNPSYSRFFEACRLMRGLIEIPLDGYLLTPVQRICKYPLQLGELLKYTKPEHQDYEKVREALEAMKNVATLINERKRKMESLEKLAAWQQRVEGWEGEDLIDISSQLVHQGDACRVTSGVWTNNITLFLFDHQIVYCKKDLLKRNVYIYKGRILLDTSEVIDLPDGKNQQFGVTIRHGIKVYNYKEDKWLVFCCRSYEEKAKWLEALMEERKLVAQDKLEGLELPPAARRLAKMAASFNSRPNKPRRKMTKVEPKYGVNSTSHYSDNFGGKTGRKVGTWFTFGGGKRNSRSNIRHGNSSAFVT